MNAKTAILVDAFKNVILSETDKHIDKIILFGSYARGEATNESDIDFLVLSDFRQNYFENRFGENISDALTNLMLEHGLIFSYIAEHSDTFTRTSDFYPLFKNVLKDGVTVYEKI